MANDSVIVGLDIGSTKVCAVVGEVDENGSLQITGVGCCPSAGLRKGVVVNIEATVNAIEQAVHDAELMSGQVVHNCWMGIGGSHIDGINSKGTVAVTGKNRELREISEDDIDRVIETASAVKLPLDRKPLDVIPQSFSVDNQKGIRNPINMIGVRLEAEVHIITCAVTGAENLFKCVNRAGFHVDGLVLKTLCAARSVLTPEEMDLGVALVDLGGGTTDTLLFQHGTPYSTMSIPAGASLVTSDIAFMKNISQEAAEKIKRESACCWESLLGTFDEEVIIPGPGGRSPVSVPRRDILDIVKPRMSETLAMVKDKVFAQVSPRSLGCGIVLTGGGAELSGAADLAQEIFRLPVRLGVPFAMGGLAEEYRTPAYATAMGLVVEGWERSGRAAVAPDETGTRSVGRRSGNTVGKVVNWIKKEFF